MNRIPMEIASALLAGCWPFGMQAFSAAETNLPLVLVMLLAYLLSRRMMPRYAVIITLLVGTIWAALMGQMQWSAVHAGLAIPVYTAPVFSLQALVSLALPLFVVTMASQNLPGVAVIRATGYPIPVSKVISMTGVATLLLAPFGGYALNLSAITAAICMGMRRMKIKQALHSCCRVRAAIHSDWHFGAVVTGLLTAFPKELVACIAGLALLGSIGGGMATAFKEEKHREAALITFLVTLSGVVIAGVGSAFWVWLRVVWPCLFRASGLAKPEPSCSSVVLCLAGHDAHISQTSSSPCKYCSSQTLWNPLSFTRTRPLP